MFRVDRKLCPTADVQGNRCERPDDHVGLHYANAWWFTLDGNSLYDGRIPADVVSAAVPLW